MKNNTVAIITVVYKNYSVLDDFMKSLQSQTDTNFELFIADVTEDKQPIKGYEHIPYTVIGGENKGYAHGVNLGLKAALKKGIEKFVVINSDVYFEKDFITEINKTFEKDPHSLIGGKIYYAPGFEFHKEKYTKKDLGNVIWYAGGTVDWNHALTYHVGVDEVDSGRFDKQTETQFITGCLTCFDKQVLDRIGFWDESYFLYYEDSDYSERAKRAGVKLIYNPKIVLWHKNAQSTGGSGSSIHQKFQEKSQLKFALKYAPLRTKLHVIKNYYLM